MSRLPEFNDMNTLEHLTSSDYCEKRNQIVWTSDKKAGIHLKNIETEEVQTIGGHLLAPVSARYSPDGSSILFIAVEPGIGRNLYVYDDSKGGIFRITDLSIPIMDPVWSPKGDRILFAAPVTECGGRSEEDTDNRVNELDDAIVIEDFGYKFDGAGYAKQTGKMHLFVCNLIQDESFGGYLTQNSSEITRLTSGDADYLHGSWMPDGQRVLCISDCFRSKAESLGYDLLTIDCVTGEKKQISHDLWMVSYPNPMRPAAMPDGKSVLMGVLQDVSPEDDEQGYPEVYLYQIYVEEDRAECIQEPDENCYQCVQFPYNAGVRSGMDMLQIDEDGKNAWFFAGWQGQCRLYRLPLTGKKEHAETAAGGEFVCRGMSRIRNGKAVVAVTKPDEPETLYLYDGTSMKPVLRSAEEYRKQTVFSKSVSLVTKTSDGEDIVHGFFYPPLTDALAKNGKYPAVLYIHGGPHPFYTYGFDLEHQCLAAQGYAVFCCNPRGCSGYGAKHQEYTAAVDGRAYEDIMTFTDLVLEKFDYIDPERIGVTGGSYGGYMAATIAEHTDRFAAYIMQRGSFSDPILYASSDMVLSGRGFDAFEEYLLQLISQAPVSYAEKIQNPVLILQGMDDLRVPVENSHQMFTALKDIHPDLPVRLALFPDTPHDQPQDPELNLAYRKEMLDWFGRYL